MAQPVTDHIMHLGCIVVKANVLYNTTDILTIFPTADLLIMKCGDDGVGVAIDGTPAFCVENNETTYLDESRTYVFTEDAKIVAAKVVTI